MGTAALIAFMAFLTDRRFTATQFAMLSALATVPRVILTAPTGWMATQMGWAPFFILAAGVAHPRPAPAARVSRLAAGRPVGARTGPDARRVTGAARPAGRHGLTKTGSITFRNGNFLKSRSCV